LTILFTHDLHSYLSASSCLRERWRSHGTGRLCQARPSDQGAAGPRREADPACWSTPGISAWAPFFTPPDLPLILVPHVQLGFCHFEGSPKTGPPVELVFYPQKLCSCVITWCSVIQRTERMGRSHRLYEDIS
jgi:hypothetical protein